MYLMEGHGTLDWGSPTGLAPSEIHPCLASIFHEESDKVIKSYPTPLLTCDDA